jgi:hypothetical protein
MTKQHTILSLEAAVARMINLDYIPEGFTLLDMTEAFMKEAKKEYERAQFIGLPSDETFRFKYRYKACRARHELASTLLTRLYSEFSTADDLGSDTITSISDLGPSVYLENLMAWAEDQFGISFQQPPIVMTSTAEAQRVPKQNWKDITINLYADNYLGYTDFNKKLKKVSFSDMTLMGKRKNEPNNVGGLLIGLSQGIKFPKGISPLDSEKTLISKLRSVLKKLTGIEDDPFYALNQDQGWRPKFNLIDDRNNASKRAKERAVHVAFDENQHSAAQSDRPFDDNEDDAAGYWLKTTSNQ